MLQAPIFTDLFILDMANNHDGDLEHANKIIDVFAEKIKVTGIRGCIKFQYRQLDSFIHPDHSNSKENKNITRFMSTRLTKENYKSLVDRVKSHGVMAMVTPFDEESVDVLKSHDVDFIKVASCSAKDWPLLEKIADLNHPVVISTGGLKLADIDKVVSFFEHKKVSFALMHCVSIYPTPTENLELNQMALLSKRYPGKVIGFSTHESPEEILPVAIAYSKGARIFERHIGLEEGGHSLNKYSSDPVQFEKWIAAYKYAVNACGSQDRKEPHAEEIRSLNSLARGVFARNKIKAGQIIGRDEVFFAMPKAEGQLSSGEFRDGMEACCDIDKLQGISISSATVPPANSAVILQESIHKIKAVINEFGINLPSAFETEFSHHYGIEKFPKFGATLITVVNRSYCKKIIIMLPGQYHPSHYHKSKEETFFVLSGTLEMIIEGRRRTLVPGDSILVQQGVWHEFWTDEGVVFDEISSTDVQNDSFYADKEINSKKRESRKTKVNQWGRYQLGKKGD
jgi:sialic acid synthase SpsE/quercetin dioxygenase-like cupin family protein